MITIVYIYIYIYTVSVIRYIHIYIYIYTQLFANVNWLSSKVHLPIIARQNLQIKSKSSDASEHAIWTACVDNNGVPKETWSWNVDPERDIWLILIHWLVSDHAVIERPAMSKMTVPDLISTKHWSVDRIWKYHNFRMGPIASNIHDLKSHTCNHFGHLSIQTVISPM